MKTNKLLAIVSLLFTVPAFAQHEVPESSNLAAAKQEFESKKEVLSEMVTRQKVEYTGAKKDPFDSAILKENKENVISVTDEENAAKALIDSCSVQGLIWGGNFPQAIINKKVYKVGDTVKGATILSIDKSGVVLSLNGKKVILNSSSAVLALKESNKGGVK